MAHQLAAGPSPSLGGVGRHLPPVNSSFLVKPVFRTCVSLGGLCTRNERSPSSRFLQGRRPHQKEATPVRYKNAKWEPKCKILEPMRKIFKTKRPKLGNPLAKIGEPVRQNNKTRAPTIKTRAPKFGNCVAKIGEPTRHLRGTQRQKLVGPGCILHPHALNFCA